MSQVLLIVPTYKEAENIPILAGRLKTALKGYNHEILVVDDNSPDRTAEEAIKLALKVLRRQEKLGITSAFIEGIQTAESEIIGLMDADLQHPPELIPQMIKEIKNGADIVIASRYAHGGKIEGWLLHRKIVSKTAIILGKILLPEIRRIKDPMSGYFILKREVIQNMKFSKTKGFKILLDILVKGKYERVIEVPYTFQEREKGESKLNRKQIWEYIKDLCRLADFG